MAFKEQRRDRGELFYIVIGDKAFGGKSSAFEYLSVLFAVLEVVAAVFPHSVEEQFICIFSVKWVIDFKKQEINT